MLERYKEEISRLVMAAAHITGLEIAVFDENSDIVSATEEYLHKKGNSVHKPSLMEVISNGNILVNKPGHMPSCVGCRFQDNCPSTIEVLNTISSNGRPVGVISFTSFTAEGHERMTKNLDSYIDLVADLSHVLSLLTRTDGPEMIYDAAFDAALNLCSDILFITDKNGNLTFASESAKALLPACSLYAINLWNLFPSISQNRSIRYELQSIHLEMGGSLYHGFLKPILENSVLSGYVLKLEAVAGKTAIKPKKNEKAFHIELFLLGNSPEILRTREQIRRFSKSDSTVIIHGETGTGKELAARSIHNLSKRSRHPFISINCASIPESLFESELFGYEEGAFTGAKRGGKPGKFELAQMGTIFLDEIGELPHYMQAKLLRVLQEHCVERVGGTRTIPIDVRIIAATNQNLEEMVAEKKFRADLFFRLNVIPLTMPPLRDREGDPALLAQHFLEKHCRKNEKEIEKIESEALTRLSAYPWPGNVRELENAIEYAINIEESRGLTAESLPPYLQRKAIPLLPKKEVNGAFSMIDFSEPVTEIKMSRQQFERQVLLQLLEKHGKDSKGKEAAAADLGVSIRTFYRKLKEAGL